MNLRTKTIGVLVVALLAVSGSAYLVVQSIVSDSFTQLERDQASKNMERVDQALSQEIQRLESSTRDYAWWDDSYEFAQDGNEDYIDSNLVDDTLVNLRVDMMVYFDADGGLTFAKAVDAEGVDTQLEVDTIEALSTSGLLITDETASASGFVSFGSGDLLAASWPILTSNGDGPLAGSLIMARWVDDRLVTELSEVTQLEVTIIDTTGRSPLTPQVTELSPGQNAIEVVDSDRLSAYTVASDLQGAPAFTVRVDMPRDIYTEGQDTLRYLLLSLLGIGVASVVLIAGLLGFTVLRPIRRLSNAVSSVGANSPARVPAERRDEIGSLGRVINTMLDSLHGYSTELETANAHLTLERERVQQLNRSLEAKVAERTKDLAVANQELRERNRQLLTARIHAATDGLTGLGNHRSFQEHIRAEVEDCDGNCVLVAAMADIDGFKDINDRYGHQTGDRILFGVAQALTAVAGPDSVFRYGGDEFAVIARVGSSEEASALAERIRTSVLETLSNPPASISVGVALYPDDASTAEELIYLADSAMYSAKAEGKNRVHAWAGERSTGAAVS